MEFLKLLVGRTHLLFKHRCPSPTILMWQECSVFSAIWISDDCAQWLRSALSCTVRAHPKKHVSDESRKSFAVKRIGGRGRDRTGDPLLAKQVLSQLSYTPTAGTLFNSRVYTTVGKLLKPACHSDLGAQYACRDVSFRGVSAISEGQLRGHSDSNEVSQWHSSSGPQLVPATS